MMLAKVIGTLVATVKHASYEGRTVLLLQPLDPEQRPKGDPYYAVAHQGAGVGDLVLAVREGGSATMLQDAPGTPIHASVVGIIDQVDLADLES